MLGILFQICLSRRENLWENEKPQEKSGKNEKSKKLSFLLLLLIIVFVKFLNSKFCKKKANKTEKPMKNCLEPKKRVGLPLKSQTARHFQKRKTAKNAQKNREKTINGAEKERKL